MPQWFDRIFPQAHISPDNHVFAEDIQQIHWLRTPKALFGYNVMLTYGLATLAIGWYVTSDNNHTYAGTRLLLGVLGILAIAFGLLSDVNCARIATSSLKNKSMDTDRVDVISARLALTQIKAWWWVGIEVAFRVTFFLSLFICFLSLGYWSIGQEINTLGDPFVHIVVLSNQL